MDAGDELIVVAVAFGLMAAILTCPVRAEGPAGRGVFAKQCASCHGQDAKGNVKMAKMFKLKAAALDLTDKTTRQQSDQQLIALITGGKGKMPSYQGKLSASDVAGVVAYMRSLGKGEGKTAKTKGSEEKPVAPETAALFAKKCGGCHGEDAKGKAGIAKAFKLELPALDLTDEGTLTQSDKALIGFTTQGKGKRMPKYASNLKESEIADLVAYLRSLGKPAKKTKNKAKK